MQGVHREYGAWPQRKSTLGEAVLAAQVFGPDHRAAVARGRQCVQVAVAVEVGYIHAVGNEGLVVDQVLGKCGRVAPVVFIPDDLVVTLNCGEDILVAIAIGVAGHHGMGLARRGVHNQFSE